MLMFYLLVLSQRSQFSGPDAGSNRFLVVSGLMLRLNCVSKSSKTWGTQFESGYCECNSASFKSFEQNISWCKDRPYVPCLCIVKKLGEVRFSEYNHAVGRRHRHMMSVVMGGDLWPPRSFATSLTQRHQTLNQFNWHWVGERDALKEERSKYM